MPTLRAFRLTPLAIVPAIVVLLLLAARPTTANPYLALIGAAGGDIESVLSDGSTLYISEGPGVTVLDVSNPAAPQIVGKSARIDAPIAAMARNGQTLYAVTERGKLAIFDGGQLSPPLVATLTHPQVGGAFRVTYADGMLFVAAYSAGVWLVDVSNPQQPQTIARYPLGANRSAYAVAVAGEHAFVAAGYSGVVALDISNPAAPLEVDSHSFGDGQCVCGIAARGSYAYVNNSLQILDISDPADLQPVGPLMHAADYNSQGVLLAGNLAISYDINFGTDVFDITDPISPTFVTTYDGETWASTVASNGTHLYLASSHDGLRIIDISARTAHEVGAYRSGGQVQDVAVSGGYAYLAGWQHGMTVIDVNTPSNPTPRAVWDTDSVDGQAVAVNDGYAYFLDERYGLRVFDISNPLAPVLSGGPAISGVNQDLRNVLAAGSRTFVGTDLTYAYNTQNRAAPLLRQFVDGTTYSMALSGNYLYRAGGIHGLTILDVSNLSNMVEVGRHDMGFAVAVDKRGSTAYVLALNGLHTYDVSNPAAPTPIGFYAAGPLPLDATLEPPGDVQVVNGRAFLALGPHGLLVLDVSDPAAPTLIAALPTIDSARRLQVVDDHVYVADEDGGLLVYRFSTLPMAVTLGAAGAGGAGGAGGAWPVLAAVLLMATLGVARRQAARRRDGRDI